MSSTLTSLFNRASFGVRCKTCLNLNISRIKLLRNRRELQLRQMRKEISQFLQNGQESIAHIRVEHIIREQNILAAYEIIELFCEFVLARVPIIETQRDCPVELQEAVATIIFASPRCSDLPELMQVKNLFTTKYGKEFVSAASELRPDSNVNRTVIEKLSVSVPPSKLKLKLLKAIAEEYNLYWNSSNMEEELSKKHEDLLVVGSPVFEATESIIKAPPMAPPMKPGLDSQLLSTKNDIHISASSQENQKINNQRKEFLASESSTSAHTSSHDVLYLNNLAGTRAPDVLERARAAIAAADRASSAARAAADLLNSSRMPR